MPRPKRHACGEGVEFITCLLCGRPFKAIKWAHLVHKHGFDPEHPIEEYKSQLRVRRTWSRHTLRKTVRSRNATLERTGRRWTKGRVIQEIRNLKKQGRVLASSRVQSQVGGLVEMARRIFGSWRVAVESAGLEPRREGLRQRWSRAEVIESIRRERRQGTDLSEKAMLHGKSAIVSAARRSFGTWGEALRVAGIDPAEVRRARRWRRAEVLQAIREMEPVLPAKRVLRVNSALWHAASRHVGSWVKAVRMAGRAYPEGSGHRGRP